MSVRALAERGLLSAPLHASHHRRNGAQAADVVWPDARVGEGRERQIANEKRACA